MRTVFMGTPDFAVPALDALHGADGIDVIAVFTQPDAVSKRGSALQPTPVKVRAAELGIPVHTPATLKNPEVAATIRDMAPDVIVVVSYGNLLPADILDIPRYGCINAHASLLPRWRGAAPIERAILADDECSGVSIMQMDRGLDTGAYCMQRKLRIDDKSAMQLGDELALLGAQMLVEVLPMIESGNVSWTPQDDALATYADKIVKSEMLLSPSLDAHSNVLRVRASGHRAPARAVICGRSVAVLEARELVVDGDDMSRLGIDVLDLARMAPGQAAYLAKRLLLSASDGVFEVLSVKPDGKNPMDAKGFAAGVHAQFKSGQATWMEVDR